MAPTLSPDSRDLRLALDLLPVGVVVAHDCTIAYANRLLGGYYGQGPEALIGQPLAALMRESFREGVLERVAAWARGERTGPLAFGFDRGAERVGLMELTSVSRLQFAGRPALLLTLRDVTEERAESERLQMAERMAAVGTLAAGVAHEINNPLACVTANLDVLREELAAAEERRREVKMSRADLIEALDDAREGAERVRRIVRDLRLLTPTSRPAPRPA